MNIFHKELKKKFGKIYVPNLFNLFVTIKLSYVQELYERDISFVVIKVKYDNNIGIIGYSFIKYGDILNPNDKIDSYFTLLTCETGEKPEIRILDKSEVIFLPVKTCLRKLKIKKLLNE